MRILNALSLVLYLTALSPAAAMAAEGPRLRAKGFRPPEAADRTPDQRVNEMISEKCKESWRDTTLDHFSWAAPHGRTTYKQRYFICDEHWQSKSSPIFFYTGNESPVDLYLQLTGFVWENAPDFGALVIFAEHRYYGKSKPFGDDTINHMEYLTTEQAMADYAEMIVDLKGQLDAPDAPVIAFGGSYGGMLTAWMRVKYPHLVAGGIAASAPIWWFEGQLPPVDPTGFAQVVTHDANVANSACADNARAAWALMFEMGADAEGRAAIHEAMQLCPEVTLGSSDEVLTLAEWLASAFEWMAMGNYPYPSTYMTGDVALPAWPVTKACKHLERPNMQGVELLRGVSTAASIFTNYTGTHTCYDYKPQPDESANINGVFWSWQYCTEMFMPMGRDGVRDMFWEQPWDAEAAAAACEQEWGVRPRQLWAVTEWGGRNLAAASNIVFSNGLLDPWSAGQVLESISETLEAVVIPEGAHHIDLMFSHPDDPPSVIAAREVERAAISRWIEEWASTRSASERMPRGGHVADVEGGRPRGGRDPKTKAKTARAAKRNGTLRGIVQLLERQKESA